MYFRRMLALIRILFMKKNLKYTLPALFLVAAAALSFAWKAPSDDQEKVVMLLVHDALTGVHYQAKDIDDAFSHEVLEFFLESMDAEKRFLQQSDIDQMRVSRGPASRSFGRRASTDPVTPGSCRRRPSWPLREEPAGPCMCSTRGTGTSAQRGRR